MYLRAKFDVFSLIWTGFRQVRVTLHPPPTPQPQNEPLRSWTRFVVSYFCYRLYNFDFKKFSSYCTYYFSFIDLLRETEQMRKQSFIITLPDEKTETTNSFLLIKLYQYLEKNSLKIVLEESCKFRTSDTVKLRLK